MSATTVSEAVLERLEALTARLDEQAARIASLETENAGLRAAQRVAPAGPVDTDRSEPKVGRRGMLTKALGATAAAALLTVAKEATTAEASSRTTLIGASTDGYGIAAAVGGFDAATLIPNLGGLGFGVIGTFGSPGYAPPFNAGVLGQGQDAFYGVIGLSQGNPGVFGQSTGGIGVQGVSTGHVGVYGISSQGSGCGGAAFTPGQSGLFGVGYGAGAYGFYGTGQNGGSAALFVGAVTVQGAFQVVGGPKNALVKHPDGSLRRMYCQESPEPWFEDFGTGQLKDGRAEVALDPEFDAVVRGDDYRVFLTPIEVDCSLYVSRKGPHRFEVRSVGGKAANGSFDYRVVARRLDDVGRRMEKVELPKLPTIDLDRLPRPDATVAPPSKRA